MVYLISFVPHPQPDGGPKFVNKSSDDDATSDDEPTSKEKRTKNEDRNEKMSMRFEMIRQKRIEEVSCINEVGKYMVYPF